MSRHCRLALTLLVLLLIGGMATAVAHAGPPSYLLLRQPEAPGPRHQPGFAAAALYDVRAYPYAYGYFGIAPRTHASRHFGIRRDYIQWSRW